YLQGESGPLLDGMASWWAAIHGYNHPEINGAAMDQLKKMSHVMFGGLTHEPAVALARALLKLLPPGLSRIFYADSGSVSVEVALKMAVQYWQGLGHGGKQKILTIRGGYHGDTFGAMSVCDPDNGMHHKFSGLLPRQIFAPRPSCPFDQPFDPSSLDPVTALVEEHKAGLAALVVEPIVQGAGGMYFYHPQYLAGLRRLCDDHGMLLICDEIATGFGRTGKMFASQWAGVTPDILCLGKALTGGYLSLAATITTEAVAQGLSQGGGVLMHGPTFMANPLACAIATKSLELLTASPWERRISRIEEGLKHGLAPLADLPQVADVRVLGGIGVVETTQPVDSEKCRDFFIKEGVWIRPFNKLVYTMPPYILSPQEVERITRAMSKLITQNAHL
ncbi:MAG: adenosylmethionine--8-amino-7-oxononanoate transaminase, partial [Desulfovibrionales bacterium]|nr:adenosylmethionine--8-amino-7-oxononanoate transaminase [Desulfovibrionales bacterium]